MNEDENVQIPAARMTDRHVSDAIASSDKAQLRRQRAARVRKALDKLGVAGKWLCRRVEWLISNAGDILKSLALFTAILAVAESAGWIDLALIPGWLQGLVIAMREVFS